MSFALLALICLVALTGPLLSIPRWLHLPVVIGELAVGILLGATGFGLLDAKDATFDFLAQVGFALVMFAVGTNVPIRSAQLRANLGIGVLRALVVAAAATGVGLGVDAIFHTGHGLIYAVVLASSSASVILPALGEHAALDREPLASIVPQIAIADAACIVMLPLALQPEKAGVVGLGALAVLGFAALGWLLLRWLEVSGWRKRVHEVSEDRGLAVELRLILAFAFGAAAVAAVFGVSPMLAGFSAGVAVAAVGEPRRVAKQVFALTEGFFSPIFFVWLGAAINLRDLVGNPTSIALGIVLGLAALVVHAVPVVTRQSLPAGMLTAAQLGVPVAAATIGTASGVLGQGEAPALLLGAIITIASTAILAPRVERAAAQHAAPTSVSASGAASGHAAG